jgi:5-methylcytosine-specific restriction endonuclease McrA
MTAEEFYGSGRWQRLRAAILRRDKYQCQICKRYGKITEAKEVHHIKHFEDYPELATDPDNLISLCRACHNACHPEKTQKTNRGSPRGGKF